MIAIALLVIFNGMAAVNVETPAGTAVSDQQIEVEIDSAREGIDRCVIAASASTRMPIGDLVLRWQIGADGTSNNVVVVTDTLGVPTAVACVTGVVANVRFPAASAGRDVEYTLHFPRRGGLSREEIQRTVLPAIPRLKGCYDNVLKKDYASAGTVRFVWKILGTGEVGEILVDLDTLAKPEATACMRAVLAALRFPKPKGGGVVNVTYPFVFSSNEPASSTGCNDWWRVRRPPPASSPQSSSTSMSIVTVGVGTDGAMPW